MGHAIRPLYLRMSEQNKTPNANYETFKNAIENDDPEISANSMISLINITSYLLSRQIISLENAFMNEGGMRERMFRARNEKRNKK